MSKVLEVNDLSVTFALRNSEVRAVNDLSFTLEAGETLAVVGESGSGKSQAFLSIMGLLARNGRTTGTAMMGDINLVGMRTSQLDHIRGKDIAMIFQDPMTSLNPSLRVKTQLSEVLVKHRGFDKDKATRAAVEMLERVGIPEPAKRANAYPHEMSGGMRQRVMIAMALMCEPRVVIADEPTTALDVTIQAEILELLDGLKTELGMSMILVTHDMGVVARYADRVGVMYAGRLVETGPTPALFSDTRHQYTHALLSSIPSLEQDRARELFSIPGSPPDPADPQPGCRFAPRCAAATARCTAEFPPATDAKDPGHAFACWNPVAGPTLQARSRGFAEREPAPADAEPRLRVADLVREHPVSGWAGRGRSVKAVSGVSFEVAAGETFGLVGESGCGKSSLGRMLVALDTPTSGTVSLDGEPVSGLRPKELAAKRTQLQMMFQDSNASLDPKMKIGAILREPFAIQGIGTRAERTERATALLDDVGLGPGILERYPYELSGGQRQRIGLARALALEPRVLVADEPVSALDVSIRSQVLNLMRRLQAERGLSSVVISHDLSVVRYLSDRVGVMYLGKLVEVGTTEDVYRSPAHPYTAGLLAAVPVADPAAASLPAPERVRGELPSPLDPPSGCRFRTRCPLATERCATEEPVLDPVGAQGSPAPADAATHRVACHYPLQRTEYIKTRAAARAEVSEA